jgi:hypothetical protein
MKSSYTSGNLTFNLLDLLDDMTIDEKRELAESLACQADVVMFVGQQIIDKWTESGFYSGLCCTASPEPTHGLDKVWRDVAKASGEVAKREIERLEDALRSEKKATESAWNEYHKIANRRYGASA